LENLPEKCLLMSWSRSSSALELSKTSPSKVAMLSLSTKKSQMQSEPSRRWTESDLQGRGSQWNLQRLLQEEETEWIEETDLKGQSAETDEDLLLMTNASTATDAATGLQSVAKGPEGEAAEVLTVKGKTRTGVRAGALSVEAEDTLHESAGRGVGAGPEALAGAEAMQKGVTEDGTRDAELHQEGDTRAPVEAGLGVNAGQEVNAVMEATGAAPQFEAETA